MTKVKRRFFIQFRASELESGTLDRLSSRLGLSLSETMRLLIREAATQHGICDPEVAILSDRYPALRETQNGNQH